MSGDLTWSRPSIIDVESLRCDPSMYWKTDITAAFNGTGRRLFRFDVRLQQRACSGIEVSCKAANRYPIYCRLGRMRAYSESAKTPVSGLLQGLSIGVTGSE